MIHSIEIKNFKSIKSKYFPLRNLNVLMGLNGTGKSSLIQALLCLRQSKDIANGRLDLNNDEYISLGKSKDVFYQYGRDENLALSIKFSGSDRLNFIFDEYKHLSDYFLDQNIHKNESVVLSQLQKTEPLFTNNFQYLKANRFEPRHLSPQNYRQVVGNRNMGNRGEFTAHFIEVYANELLSFKNLLHQQSLKKDSVTGQDNYNDTLLNQINFWMGEISPKVQVVTTPIASDYITLEYQFLQQNLGFTDRFKPENAGFGMSYVLPVVVSLLSARPGELLIIENPESRIHSRAQAELGKLIGMAALNEVQIIIETHSDHILNGIRVAVKENNDLKDKTILFYFEKEFTEEEQFSSITNIEIDKNGELSEYPLHMLDEWSNQLLKLL